MTLRYGNGNPFAFLLTESPIYYYLLLATVSIAVSSLVIVITIFITNLIEKRKKAVLQ